MIKKRTRNEEIILYRQRKRREEWELQHWTRNIYVSSSATPGGDGSYETPYNAPSDLNWSATGVNSITDFIAAGIEVYVNLQGTFTSSFTPLTSGTSAAKITVQGYGTGATIDTAAGSGIYNNGYDYIDITNVTLTDCAASGISLGPGSTNINITNCTITGTASTGILVSAANDKNSHTISINACTITGNGGNGIWLNFGDADVGEGGIIYGVDVLNSTLSTNTGYGFRMFSADTTNELAYDIYLNNNTIQTNATGGVIFRFMDNTSGENKISNNIISGNGSGNTLGGIHIGYCANPIVENNVVYDNETNGIDGRGIYFDTGVTDFICQRNITYGHTDNSTPPSQSSGIAVTAANTGLIAYNVSYSNDAGITIGGAVTAITIYQNTIFNNTDRGISIQNSSDSSEVTLKNNIIYNNTTYGIYDDDAVHEPTIDYNCYDGNGTDLFQIAAKGANAVTDSPDLISTGQLETGSPALNTGVAISGINDVGTLDLWGNVAKTLKNIGAYNGEGEGE